MRLHSPEHLSDEHSNQPCGRCGHGRRLAVERKHPPGKRGGAVGVEAEQTAPTEAETDRAEETMTERVEAEITRVEEAETVRAEAEITRVEEAKTEKVGAESEN